MTIEETENEVRRLFARNERRMAKVREDTERISALTRKLTNARRIPVPDSQVITFVKRFGTSSSRRYQYAAIRDDRGLWTVTGRLAPNGVRWDELVAFMRKDNEAALVFTEMTSSRVRSYAEQAVAW